MSRVDSELAFAGTRHTAGSLPGNRNMTDCSIASSGVRTSGLLHDLYWQISFLATTCLRSDNPLSWGHKKSF